MLSRDDLDLPDELYGFGGWLLWLVATRATTLVDRVFATGTARPSRSYGMVESHHVPTPALIAWLLVAAEFGVTPDDLRARSAELTARHKVLRTMVSRAVGEDPRVFKDRWLHDLAVTCELAPEELELLRSSRADGPHPVDAVALRRAIARTLATGRRAPVTSRAAAALHTLPRDLAVFTGRDAELRRVSEVAAACTSAGAPGICSITGMAGIGKTAVAIRAAHQIAPLFPDGQIFVSLHGHTPGVPAAAPAEVLADVLLTVGVGAEQVPPTLELRMRLWRDRLAGKRVLLVLDDATGHEQVRPLLPGTAGCLVIVTSRRRLTALEGATAISLGTLPATQSAELIAALADRFDVGAWDVSDIAWMCGHLPLAVSMLGRQLHHHPAWSPDYLSARLAATSDRLSLLTAENVSVAAAFDLSYRELPADLQRLFRRLSLQPGSDVDPWSAAALDGTLAEDASRGLNALYDHHLLDEPVAGRYRFHDLIREHARTLAAADPAAEREAALHRLADYYLHAACAAGRHFVHHRREIRAAPALPRPPALPDFGTMDDAAAWLAAELPNLDAFVGYAAEHGLPAHAAGIAAAMHGYLRAAGHPDVGIRLHSAAVAAARSAGDRQAEARAVADLAVLQSAKAHLQAGMASQVRALELCRDLGDEAGAAEALWRLGSLQSLTGDYPTATASVSESLRIYRVLGDRLGQADALTNLGFLQYRGDDCAAAVPILTEALSLYAAERDPRGELGALNYLAVVQQQIGHYPAAIASFARALELSLALGDRNAEAAVRTLLGCLQCVIGDVDEAIGNLIRALGLHTQLGNPIGQASALNYLGLAQRLTGRAAAAAASQQRALRIYRSCGSQSGIANALLELGNAQGQVGDYAAAEASLQSALQVCRQIGDVVGQAEALNNMGELMRSRGQASEARSYHERALHLVQEIAAPIERARALEGVGRAYLEDGERLAAHDHLDQALTIYQQLGSPDAGRVRMLLSRSAESHAASR